jgi:hypothetical protein
LLGAPASISLSHVARRLDQGDKFEGNVTDTDDANGAASNVANDLLAKKKASEEDVDW